MGFSVEKERGTCVDMGNSVEEGFVVGKTTADGGSGDRVISKSSNEE